MKLIIMSMVVSLLLFSSTTFARQNNSDGLSHSGKKCTYASKEYDEGSVVTMGGVNKTCKNGEWIKPIESRLPRASNRIRFPAGMYVR